MSTPVCRVCLAGNLGTKCIENIELQNIFEKLTGLKVGGALCFVCSSQLRRCGRFADTARRSAAFLAKLLHKGLEATQESLALLQVAPTPALTFSRCTHTEFVQCADECAFNQQVIVKVEALVSTDDNTTAEAFEDSIESDNILEEDAFKDIKSIKSDDKSSVQSKDAKLTGKKCESDVKKRRRRGPEAHTCEFCGKVCKRTHDLRVHRRTHTGERPHACERCGKAFASSSTLLGHRRTHLPRHLRPAPHECSQCGKAFRLKDTLRQHLKTHNARTLACPHCDKTFALETKLRLHVERHSLERTHSCDRCARAFKTRAELRRHLLVHGARRHVCTDCARAFRRKRDLALHLRVHSGLRPHACVICGKAFSQPSSLRAHALTHTTARPFACELCSFRFKDKFSLAKHVRTHAAGPPCACSVCGKECASRRAAQAHARSHVRKPSSCGRCGKTFCDVSRMRRHERNVRCTEKDVTRTTAP